MLKIKNKAMDEIDALSHEIYEDFRDEGFGDDFNLRDCYDMAYKYYHAGQIDRLIKSITDLSTLNTIQNKIK